MDVDDQHHQLARLEALIHLFAEGAVVVAVVEVVLHHLIGVDELPELLYAAVVVVHALLLPGAGCTGGGGNGLFDLGVCLDDGVHELFRIAVMARGVEDDGSHKKAFQL